MKYILIFLFVSILFINCQNSVSPNHSSIIGIWIEKGYEDNVRIFERSRQLNENRPGYIFYFDNTLIDRKNVGWCGTPPIAYSNYEGTWKKLAQNRLEIIVGYWGGLNTFDVEIISVDDDQLKLRYYH